MSILKTETAKSASVRFARRMSNVRVSAVREILKVTERPEIISFAGGLPAPELFPVREIARAHAQVFDEDGPAALQYSTTEGWRPLREWIAARMRKRGIAADADRVLITTGSQQGIDLAGKVFLEPGDRIVVENPCYVAALQAFSAYEATPIPVDSDDDGMRMDQIEKALTRDPKLIYIVSEFSNPKGITLSAERRSRLIDLSLRYGVPILEDNPYGELRYAGVAPEPLAALDRNGLVIHIGTFSKTLSPGMRIGWLLASEEIFKEVVTAKQAADLHTSTVEQRAAARMLQEFDYDGHVAHLCLVYGERCKTMRDAIERHFPSETRWTKPDGGLFLWVELPETVNADEVYAESLREQVAFVPGASFFAGEQRTNFMRLNFSNQTPERIEEGIKRIAGVLKRRMK
ncbi:MAG TPA: PLP-dependent aminotransferase family protein [Blastocatellia bacterium]|nr:PLP-dependent aminotransferase family protein [Blastocatellia bacterium]